MGKDKPPTGSLYPRESVVCFFLFVVELAAVWSMVALIYNTFMVYIPTANEKEEGLLPEPVMCTTTRNVVSDQCSWWSCMEWCLSSTQPPDSCIHVFSRVRYPGSNIRLSNCSPASIRECDVLDMDDPFADFIFDCKEDFICKDLTGIFICDDPYQPGVEDYQKQRGGTCKNITLMYECSADELGETVHNCARRKADCLDLTGVYSCKHGRCQEMVQYHCERRCKDIACDRNVIIQSGDNIFLGDCERVEEEETGDHIWTSDGLHTLLGNCISVEMGEDNMTYVAKDCVNGTLMPRELMPKKVNYTKLLELFTSEEGYHHRLDRDNNTKLPFDIHITIYNETKLKMNHEGCSNTLSEKCTHFHREFGKDGRNYTSPSRFPCYYTPNHGEFVAANLDLEYSNKIFLVMLIVPLVIFISSCFFCLFCSFLIIVDEKGHMHLRGCYHWFRRPPTEYEKWKEQHEKNRIKREMKEAKKQMKEEEKLRKYREEMERRREEIRRQGLIEQKGESVNSFTDCNIQIHAPQDI